MTELKTHYWEKNYPVLKQVANLARSAKNVLEIGPGEEPFELSTEFVDFQHTEKYVGKKFHEVNVNRDKLPFEDKSFDFVYCRHTIEDLHNPMLLLSEMNRVGKAGYIETPSPAAEFTRKIDAGDPPWRGYNHHHSFVYVKNDVLELIPKYPIVEYLSMDLEELIKENLNLGHLYWNTYFLWEDHFEYRTLLNFKDYQIFYQNDPTVPSYGDVIRGAINTYFEETPKFMSKLYGNETSSNISVQRIECVI